MDGNDDHDLLRLYRRQQNGLPPATLDARILAASRAYDKRRWFLVLAAAAAIAAALIPTARPFRHEIRPTASATAGLYDGLVSQQLANPQLVRQMAIMQLPGGSDGGKANGL